MRLIARFSQSQQAGELTALLQHRGIESCWEPERKDGEASFAVWAFNEDQREEACSLADEYQKGAIAPPPPPETPPPVMAGLPPPPRRAPLPMQKSTPQRPSRHTPWTFFLLVVCTVVFLFSWLQGQQIEETEGPLAYNVGLAPIMRPLVFDYPVATERLYALIVQLGVKTAEQIPTLPAAEQQELKEAAASPHWRGLYDYALVLGQKQSLELVHVPMFEKEQQGEWWRLWTPILLHANWVHLLFNMVWLWTLLPAVEVRLGRGRTFLFLAATALVSNSCQYLITGPDFLGISGVIAALAGFIWVRQRLAPWEGYTLPRAVLGFLLIFIFAVAALDSVVFLLQLAGVLHAGTFFANSGHIAGLAVGALCGTSPFFDRQEIA